jgi:hypothetical protein
VSSFVPVAHALAVPRNTVKRSGYLTIYALCGSDTRVRYVGVTRKSLEARLLRHMQEPTNRSMAEFLDNAYLDGCRPRMVALEYVSRAEWEDAERGWIYWFRQRGQLLNVDRGGLARSSEGNMRAFRAGVFQAPSSKSKRGKGPTSALKLFGKRVGPERLSSGSMDAAASTPAGLSNALKAPVGERWADTAVRIRRPRQVPVEGDCRAEGNDFGGRSSLLQSRVPTPTRH